MHSAFISHVIRIDSIYIILWYAVYHIDIGGSLFNCLSWQNIAECVITTSARYSLDYDPTKDTLYINLMGKFWSVFCEYLEKYLVSIDLTVYEKQVNLPNLYALKYFNALGLSHRWLVTSACIEQRSSSMDDLKDKALLDI